MDIGKNFGSGQEAQQKKPEGDTLEVTESVPYFEQWVADTVLTSDQEALNQFAHSDVRIASPVSHEPADVNMEAAISTEDVIRAGGFGAKDDISSLLPTAIDSTDFEASLRDARDFEGEKEQPSRPGLGYKVNEADKVNVADNGSKP